MESEQLIKQLEKVPAEARGRVSDALKKALDKQLAAEGIDLGRAAAFSRSKGPIFSRSKNNALREDLLSNPSPDSQILENVSKMKDEDFSKFAERLATLKKIKG